MSATRSKCDDCHCQMPKERDADSLCYACLHRRYLVSRTDAGAKSRLLTRIEASLEAALAQIRAFNSTPRSEDRP